MRKHGKAISQLREMSAQLDSDSRPPPRDSNMNLGSLSQHVDSPQHEVHGEPFA